MADPEIRRSELRRSSMPKLLLALGWAALVLAEPASAAAKVDGFDVPPDRAVPGFEAVAQTAAPAAGAAAKPAPVKPTPAKPVAAKPATNPDVGAVAGRYAIVRPGAKESGCMLTLGEKSVGKGGFSASLSPACKDEEIVIFDPASWQVAKGELVLVARKGHMAHFTQQADGSWAKDAKEGKPLVLKKM